MNLENEQTEQIEPTEVQTSPAQTEENAPEATEEDYKYELPDGSRFKSQEEALKHAQKLIQDKEIELATANAYQQGIHDFASRIPQSGNVTPQQPEEDTAAWETEFYSNPKKVLAEVEAKAIEKAETRLAQKLSAQEADKQIWSEFTSLHPDLADFKADVDGVTDSNREVVQALFQTKGKKAAMDYVAQKTRAKFEAYLEATKKRTELPRTRIASPTPGQTNVTQKKPTEQPLDFAAQLRKHKMERLGF